MFKRIKRILIKLFIKIHQNKYNNRLTYAYFKNHSDTLAIVFSGFSETPRYNYIRTLRKVKYDKLFILDDFAYRGSYYWYQNGSDEPKRLVEGLLNKIIGGGNYSQIITLGSSKGGTCAIYYGLKTKAQHIYAAACQYHVGKYLNTDNHQRIFKEMMGEQAGAKEQELLDNELSSVIHNNKDSNCQIHLLYSVEEHTYEDHIIDLINDLDENNITHIDTIEHFTNHGDVGKFFSPWIINELNKTTANE